MIKIKKSAKIISTYYRKSVSLEGGVSMRREIILEVAFKKFSEKGYNASLSEIAKVAGIRKQTLYNYFESKDDLFLKW